MECFAMGWAGWLVLSGFFFDEGGTQGCQTHTDTGHDDAKDRIVSEEIFENEPAENTANDLGNGDRHVEKAHINSHLAGRYGTGQHRIGHRQDTSPGDTDTDHRND